MAGMVRTVLGDVEASALGRTLKHQRSQDSPAIAKSRR
jgi:hypothetical protein